MTNGDNSIEDELTRALALQKTEPVEAFQILTRLAERGIPEAMYGLAWHYHPGAGVGKNAAEAEKWYWRAYKKGDNELKARVTYSLGVLYCGTKAYEKARGVFTLGFELDYTPAIYHLGRMYRQGLGGKRNWRMARVLYEYAVSKGHLLAKRDLGIMFMSGRFGPLNMLKGWALNHTALKEFKAILENNPDLKPWDDQQIYLLTGKQRDPAS